MRISLGATIAAALTYVVNPAYADDRPAGLDTASIYKPVEAPLFTSRFDGAYVALTGGYDFSDGEVYGLSAVQALKGAKIGVAGGYNVTSGRLLVGFEARAQYAFAESGGQNSFSYGSSTIPFGTGATCFSCSGASFTTSGSYPLGYNQTYSERLTRPFSGDLSMRAGIIFDDWLLFGRAGAGFEKTRLVTTSDQSGNKTCVSPTISYVPSVRYPGFGNYDQLLSACGSIVSGPITVTSVERVSPLVTMAGGIEKNFGNIFVRAEAELIIHFPVNGGPTYYSPAANMAVGYRF